ncbi:Hypothetical protein GbCGDNIH4_5018 [Granulibacter bethesdensis CGDNIH4]|nr:Hypothetical protein GbCGDNIH4_5018 [Granulibacter bethesdensis CGDNIH4]
MPAPCPVRSCAASDGSVSVNVRACLTGLMPLYRPDTKRDMMVTYFARMCCNAACALASEREGRYIRLAAPFRDMMMTLNRATLHGAAMRPALIQPL